MLLDPSNPSEVKIGFTTKTVGERVQELFTTGRSRPLLALWDEYVANPKSIESKLHDRFAAFRVHPGREFFAVPPQEAIRALIDEAAPNALTRPGNSPGRAEILPQLRARHERIIRSDVRSATIVVTKLGVYLETSRVDSYGGMRRGQQILSDHDISIDVADDPFTIEESAEQNAERFLRLTKNEQVVCSDVFNLELMDFLKNRIVEEDPQALSVPKKPFA
ncbi:T5orf172 domain-containing protein [Arthrobacter sp. ok909]|nr:T5orf172 domain-containing protein [Arthrobacter sp. ok909]